MSENENFEKPIKPKLEEFELDDQQVKILTDFESKCDKIIKIFSFLLFCIFSAVGVLVIKSNQLNNGLIFLVLIVSAFVTWSLIPFFFKNRINEFVVNKTKTPMIGKIRVNYAMFNYKMAVYKEKNKLYERILRRATWQYWLSLTPLDFENAVGDLFLDMGYEVWTTKATGDHGVDLYLEKDEKKYVVQCKTYKKKLGPSAARDLYGTMMAQGAIEGFLAAPFGFSDATKAFCKDKPIRLLDIDDLSKMTYDFEDYSPYWLDNLLENSKSMDDVVKGLNKNLGVKIRRR